LFVCLFDSSVWRAANKEKSTRQAENSRRRRAPRSPPLPRSPTHSPEPAASRRVRRAHVRLRRITSGAMRLCQVRARAPPRARRIRELAVPRVPSPPACEPWRERRGMGSPDRGASPVSLAAGGAACARRCGRRAGGALLLMERADPSRVRAGARDAHLRDARHRRALVQLVRAGRSAPAAPARVTRAQLQRARPPRRLRRTHGKPVTAAAAPARIRPSPPRRCGRSVRRHA